MMRRGFLPIIVAAWLAVMVSAGCQSRPPKQADDTFVGAWSSPSLSNPQVHIVIQLLPDGQATEQIGDYHGTGTWRVENSAARILWASGWVGLLRETPQHSYELLTWKAGSSPAARPDDVQTARRISSRE